MSRRSQRKPRRILVPVDFTPQTRRAVKQAILLGRETRAKVYLLHAPATEIGTLDSACRTAKDQVQLMRLESARLSQRD